VPAVVSELVYELVYELISGLVCEVLFELVSEIISELVSEPCICVSTVVDALSEHYLTTSRCFLYTPLRVLNQSRIRLACV
jgi:hypothetical protein